LTEILHLSYDFMLPACHTPCVRMSGRVVQRGSGQATAGHPLEGLLAILVWVFAKRGAGPSAAGEAVRSV
jgi:hypothetical protein